MAGRLSCEMKHGASQEPIRLSLVTAFQDLRGIREVNVCVSFCGDGSHLSFLLLCELLHKLSFRVILRRGPK